MSSRGHERASASPDSAAGQAIAWHALADAEVFDRLGCARSGLSTLEAERRLAADGPNALHAARRDGIGHLLWRQVNSPLVWVLVVASAIAVPLGKPTDGAVVFAVVVLNTILGVIQEFRAGKAIAALAKMAPENTLVLREGRQVSMAATELVTGDVVFLASGDKVPADLRLVETKNLRTDEAALTGESLPVQKTTDCLNAETPLGDRANMAFGGTLVSCGTGVGVVVATGSRTELGRISDMLGEAQEVTTPLTRTLTTLARQISIGVLLVALVMVGIGTWRVVHNGLSLVEGLRETLLFSIALAVGAIPEGLPAIVTIALAIGVQRMARRNAVIRNLPAAETLGSTTVICTDKTGTLTRNEMTVTETWTPEGACSLSGVGYEPRGSFHCDGQELQAAPEYARVLLREAALCNDASLLGDSARWSITGDPTEGALVVAAEKAGLRVDEARREHTRIDTFPFDSEHQFMATLHEYAGQKRIVLKGAPEIVLGRCSLSKEFNADGRATADRLALGGLRVLAVAVKEGGSLAPEELASGFRLIGLAGMIDPPRQEAVEAVRRCKSAGIAVKMITGDHLLTARAVGGQVGLAEIVHAMTGADIAGLDDERLREAASQSDVFARVAPEHKLRLVRALQASGQVVAMTGDGVNDAPALKQADLGVAMGITGTSVAREAADMVLADDNFASIAAAVEEGRRVYDNLVRSLAFVLPTNLGLALILIYAVLFLPFDPVTKQLLLPVLPTQILWINLVATVALALPLAFEAAEPDVMRRPPRNPKAPVLSGFVLQRTALAAIVMTASAVALFSWEYARSLHGGAADLLAIQRGQTMAVTTIILFQVFYMLNCRSFSDSVFRVGLLTNRAVLPGILAILALQGLFIYAKPAQTLFQSTPLGVRDLALSVLVASVVVPIISFEKWLRPRLWQSEVPPDDARLGERATLSQDFQAILDKANGNAMTVGEIMDLLEVRGHALLLVFFSVPLCLPVGIPILTSLLGPLLAFVSLFLVLGRRPWLPRRIRDRSIPHDKLEHLIARIQPTIVRFERHLHYRLLFLSQEGLPVRVHALYMMVLAMVVSIPLPILFFNLVAALPILLLSLGLLKRDGVFIVAAYIAVIPCIAMYTMLALLGFEGVSRLFEF